MPPKTHGITLNMMVVIIAVEICHQQPVDAEQQTN